MKICYFGDYDPEYARNRVILRGLRINNVEVLECNDRSKGFSRFRRLISKHSALKSEYDLVIVGHSDTRLMVPLAKLITRKRVIMDGFYSVYESYLFDRKLFKPKSIKAKYHWFLEYMACKLADHILCDTNQHIDYFVKTFGVSKKKFTRVLLGADDSVFNKECQSDKQVYDSEKFNVLFYGKFIPLQGVPYIVRAAKIIELKDHNVRLTIVGRGQTFKETMKVVNELKPNNTTFIDMISLEEVAQYISQADITLGIFGNTDKTKRVIPNKVYQSIAMSKAVISGDTLALRELFLDRENILFCNVADPEDLAQKILELKQNPELRKKNAQGGYSLFKEKTSPLVMGRELEKKISSWI